MKTWKLVAGILCMVLFAFVMFQSCAAGLVNSVEENGSSSGSAGVIVAFLMLVGGIVSVAVRKQKGNGGNIALIIIFGIAAITGFSGADNFADLNIWAGWCTLNAALALLCCFGKKKRLAKAAEKKEASEEE